MQNNIIKVDWRPTFFTLSFPYNKILVDAIKEHLPIKSFDYATKEWKVPELAVKTLDRVIGVQLDYSPTALKRKQFVDNAIDKLVDCKFQEDGWDDYYNDEHGLEFRTYQKQGVAFLSMAKKAILADDMGLGKTLQSIKALRNLDTKRNLILCPATLQWNWKNELEKHFGIESVIITGTADKRYKLWQQAAGEEGFYIMSYDLLRFDINIMPLHWDAIIADEAVYLKSAKAQRTKNAMRLESNVKIALSGMPVETKLEDFFSIFKWVRPELSIDYVDNKGNDRSVQVFEKRYCTKDFFNNIVGYKNMEELHLYTSPFILRREKKSVLTELPDKVYTEFQLELTPDARKAYDAIKNESIQWLQENTGNVWHRHNDNSLFHLVTKLLQFLENPATLGFDKVRNEKLEWLKDIYYNHHNKIVVFVNYLETVETLAREFNTHYIIKGDVDKKQRVDLVEEFNTLPSGMFVLTDAGRFGLNMTGVDTVVNYGYNYNPASVRQREDRLHRIGQLNKVQVLNPYILRTLDAKMFEIANKRLAEATNFMNESRDTFMIDRNSQIGFSEKEILDMLRDEKN